MLITSNNKIIHAHGFDNEPKGIAYVPMMLDYIHIGHINIMHAVYDLNPATIIIGLVKYPTYKKVHHSFKDRQKLAFALKDVDLVLMAVSEPLFLDAIEQLKPQWVVHGDDWAQPDAALYKTRNIIKEYLYTYGGILVEPKYTGGVSSTKIRSDHCNRCEHVTKDKMKYPCATCTKNDWHNDYFKEIG